MEEDNQRRELFETVPVRKALFTLAVPTIISQLINVVYNVVDTFFIGRTGNSYMVAAVTLCFTLFMLTVSFGNLFGIGGGSLMARLAGQRREDEARYVSAYSFYGAIGISLLYSVLVLLFLNPLLNLFGASKGTLGFARQYTLIVVVIGTLPIVVSAVLAHLLRNVGFSKQASFGLSMGGILNIALDPLFMFVLLPKGMEVAGAAIATTLSNIISMIYLLIQMKKMAAHAPLSLSFADACKTSRENIHDIYSVGVPSAILTGLFDLANIVLNSRMAIHGDLQLAAIGIVQKVERLPNAINIGICQGMLPIVAYNYTSGNHKRMHSVIHTARVTGLVVSIAAIVLLEVLAGPATAIFLDTSKENPAEGLQTLAYAKQFLRIRCLASPVQFLNYSTSYSLQAVGDGKDTLIHAFGREVIFYIPLMFILDGLYGEIGLAASLPLGELCGAILALILLNNFMKKHSNAFN